MQSRVRKVIRSILLDVRRENPFFRTTLINSGSFYEGTKVGQPDEFDYFTNKQKELQKINQVTELLLAECGY